MRLKEVYHSAMLEKGVIEAASKALVVGRTAETYRVPSTKLAIVLEGTVSQSCHPTCSISPENSLLASALQSATRRGVAKVKGRQQVGAENSSPRQHNCALGSSLVEMPSHKQANTKVLTLLASSIPHHLAPSAR
jgi:hypothetical protein